MERLKRKPLKRLTWYSCLRKKNLFTDNESEPSLYSVYCNCESNACSSEHLASELTTKRKAVFQVRKITGQASGGSKSFSNNPVNTTGSSYLGTTLGTGGRTFRAP
jgi:hypothetical protein